MAHFRLTVQEYKNGISTQAELQGNVYLLNWTTGLDYWTGLLDWTTGLAQYGVKCLFKPFSV